MTVSANDKIVRGEDLIVVGEQIKAKLEDVVHHVDFGSLEDLEDPFAYATRDEYNELQTKIDGMSTGKYYGFHASEEDLPAATDPGYAYVGESAPYALWNFDGLEWKDSGVTVDNAPVGNEEDIDQDEAGLLKLADRPTSSNQMGYVILRKNKTFAEQVTEQNTIYEIRYDFEITSNLVIPTGCNLYFNGGKLSGNHTVDLNGGTITANENERIFDGLKIVHTPELSVKWVGAKGDGVTDDTNVFLSLAVWANSQNGCRIYVPSGRYKISSNILFYADVEIYGNGASSVLDFSSETCGIYFHGEQAVLISATLSANASKGTKELTLSSTDGLSPDDEIIILNDDDYSYCLQRAYYKQGEICVIESITNNVLSLYEPIYADYKTTENIVIYKVNPHIVTMRDMRVISKDTGSSVGVVAIRGERLRNSKFSGLEISGSNHSCLSLKNCYQCNVENIHIKYFSELVGLNYGILIGNSQSIIVSNSWIQTSRHAITTGGDDTLAIVNRDILVTNCIFGGDVASGLTCVDNHENTEYFYIYDSIINDAIRISGNHIIVKNNIIYSGGSYASVLVQTVGDDFIVEGNSIYVFPVPGINSSYGILTRENYLESDKLGSMAIIKNNRIMVGKPHSTATMWGFSSLGNGSYFYSFSIVGNEFISIASASERIRLVHFSNGHSKLNFDNNAFRGNVNIALRINALTMGTDIIVRNCYFDVNDSGTEIHIEGTHGNISIRENYFERPSNSNGTILIQGTVNNVVIENNTLQFSNRGAGVLISGSVQTINLCKNNLYAAASVSGGFSVSNLTTPCIVYVVNNVLLNAGLRIQGASGIMPTGVVKNNILNGSITLKYTDQLRFLDNVNAANPDIENSTDFVSSNGRTSKRPTASIAGAGFIYYDTTLNKPIVSTGSAWVNMDGSALS